MSASGIVLENVSFAYAGAQAPSVAGFGLSVAAGECVVLAGRSGCGKTTVTRTMNGLAPRFYEGTLSGRVSIGGRDVPSMGSADIACAVGSVFQDPRSEFFCTDTTSEVAFGCENLGMPREEVLSRTVGAARATGSLGLLERRIFGLSSGERQRVAIASAYACAPSVFVFDEPSANLDPEATLRLGRVVAQIVQDGHAVVVAEHRLGYLRDVASRVVVMEDGRAVAEILRSDLLGEDAPLRARGIRSVFPERLPVKDNAGDVPASARDAVRLDVEGVSYAYGRHRGAPNAVENVSFTACGGEVVGVVGRNGAGKSTLAGVLCGLREHRSGRILVDGARCNASARRRVASYVMQDADYQLFAESVARELRLGASVDGAELEALVARTCADLGLKGLEERHPASLSGGQKQRVTIGAAVTKGARIVCLDEPTSGLDGANMHRVARMVHDLACSGRIVFVVTHDYEFALACCTRILKVEGRTLAADVPVAPETSGEVRAAFFDGLRV